MSGDGLFFRILRRRRDLLLLAEAGACLMLAGAAIRFLPFRRILATAARAPRVPPPDAPARDDIRQRVRWAVVASAVRLPWRPLCFPRGLAAQWMLRRRGVDSTLYYGAQVHEGDLGAHVWVADGDVPVIGGRAGGVMKVLVQAPPVTRP